MGNQNNFEYKIHVSIDEKNIHGDVKKILSNFQHEISDNAVNITFNGDMDNLVKQLLDLKKKFPDLDLGKSISFSLAENLRSDAEKGKEIMDGVVTHIINAVNNAASEVSNIQQKLVDASVELDKLNRKKIKLGIDEKGVADPTKALKEAERRLSSYKLEKQNTNRIREAYQDVVNIAESTGQKVSDSTKALLGNIKQSLNIDLEKETKVTQTYQQMVDNFELETLKIKNRILELQKDLQSAQTPELQIKGKLADNFLDDLQSQLDSMAGLKIKVKPVVDENVELEVSVKADSDSVEKASEAIRKEGEEAEKAVSPKQEFARANEKVAKSAEKTASVTEEAANGISEEKKAVSENTSQQADAEKAVLKYEDILEEIKKVKQEWDNTTWDNTIDKKAFDEKYDIVKSFCDKVEVLRNKLNTYNSQNGTEKKSNILNDLERNVLSEFYGSYSYRDIPNYTLSKDFVHNNDSGLSIEELKSRHETHMQLLTKYKKQYDDVVEKMSSDLDRYEDMMIAGQTDRAGKPLLSKSDYNDTIKRAYASGDQERAAWYYSKRKELYPKAGDIKGLDKSFFDNYESNLERAESFLHNFTNSKDFLWYQRLQLGIERLEYTTKEYEQTITQVEQRLVDLRKVADSLDLDLDENNAEKNIEVLDGEIEKLSTHVDQLYEKRNEILDSGEGNVLEKANQFVKENDLDNLTKRLQLLQMLRDAMVQYKDETSRDGATKTKYEGFLSVNNGDLQNIVSSLYEETKAAKKAKEALVKVNDAALSPPDTSGEDKIQEELQETAEKAEEAEEAVWSLAQKIEYLKKIKAESKFMETADDKRWEMEDKAWDAGGNNPKSNEDSQNKIRKYEEHVEHIEAANAALDEYEEKYEKVILTKKNGEKVEINHWEDLDGISLAKNSIQDIEFVLNKEEEELREEVEAARDDAEAQRELTEARREAAKSSPTQQFDNTVQKDLVYLENYKNTIEEINKLKLEPETDETKRKIEELQKLADYFFGSISVVQSEWGNDGGNFVNDPYGTYKNTLRSRGYGDSADEIFRIGREKQKLNVHQLPSEFSGIDEEMSRIETKSEGLRQSLEKDLSDSRKYVEDLTQTFKDFYQWTNDVKTEKSPSMIKAYNADIDDMLQKFPMLEQFRDKFSSMQEAKAFVNSDEWNDFLATLPEAHTYLESIGYDFERLNQESDQLPTQPITEEVTTTTSQLEKEAEVKRNDTAVTNELIEAEKKLREETSKPIVNTTGAESPTTPLPPQVEEALVNDEAKVDEVVEAEKKKFGELGTELSTDIPQAIDKKNEALDGEVTKVNEVVDAEIAKFGALETELSETIPQAINTKNEALDSEKNKVDTIVQAEIDKFGQLETKIKTDIPKAIEEKNTSLEAERDKVKEVVDAEVEMFGGLEGAVNGVKNAIDGKNNSVDEAKKKGSGKKKSSEKKKSDTDEENSSEESSENTAPLFYENDTLKKYLLGVQDRFNKANLKLGVELDKAAFEADFKKAADEVAQDFNRMFGTSITGKDVVNAIRNIEKEEAVAAEQAKKDAEDVELEYGKVLADARQAEQELADAQKKRGQEFIKENERYTETSLINKRNEDYEKLIATIDEYDKMKKRILTGEKLFGDSDKALEKLKEEIDTLFSDLEENPTVDNKLIKIIDKYISVEEKASKLEMLKTSEKKYDYLGTLADKYVNAKKNGNDAAANKYKEQFEKTKEFLRNTEFYNEKLEREAVNNFIRLNNELEESEKKAYKEMVDNNAKELDDLGKQQQKQGKQFIEEGERYDKAQRDEKANEALMERKILYDELIEAIEKYSEMSKRIASGKRIAGDSEDEAANLKSRAKQLLSQAMSESVLTDSQINTAINKYGSVDEEVKQLDIARRSKEEYSKLTKIVNEYADAKKRIATGKALAGDLENVNKLKDEYNALKETLKNGELYSEENESQALKRLSGLDAEIEKAKNKSAPKDDSEQKKRIELLNTYTNKLKEQAKYEEQIKALRKNDVSDSISDITSREEALQAIKNEIAAMGELNLTEEENLNIQNKVAQARRQYAINAQKEKKDTSKQDALNENKQKYIELLKEENKLYLQNDLAKKMGEEPNSDNVTELAKIEEKKKALEEILELEGQAEFIEQENTKASNARSEGEKKNLKAEEALLKRRQNLLQQITQWLKSNPIAERKYGSGLNESIDKLNSSAKLTPKILNEIEKEFKEVKLEATKSGDVGVGFFNVLKQRWQSLAAYIGSFASFYRVTAYVREMINTIKDLDTALTEMRKVSDESVETLKAFQKESFDIAAQVGSTAKVIQDSTADWMRLGESLNEAKESAKDASILLNVSEFESIDEATTALVAMSQAYKDMDKIDIIDKLNNIGNNFSISTDQLATGLQNAAAVLKTQGNDIDKSIALLTAANSIVQDISKASTGIRTIALRIAGTETAKEELEELGESVDDYIVQTQSKTQETIRAYTAVASNLGKGVDVLDANGNLRDTYDILLDISKVYKEIQEEDKKAGTNRAKALVEYIAGKNRSNIAASVLENPDLLEQVYKQSQDSAGSAMEENEKYLDSIEGHIAKLQNQLQKLYYDTIESGFIKGTTDILTGLTRVIDKVGLLKTAIIGIFTAIGSKKLG